MTTEELRFQGSEDMEIDEIEHSPPRSPHTTPSRDSSRGLQSEYDSGNIVSAELSHARTGERRRRGNDVDEDEDVFDDDEQPAPRKHARIYHCSDLPDEEPASIDEDEDDQDVPSIHIIASDLPVAQRIKELDGKPKIGDYDSVTQEVHTLAVQVYKAHISSENAFPAKMDELRWAKDAWTHARCELDVDLQHNSELIKLVCPS